MHHLVRRLFFLVICLGLPGLAFGQGVPQQSIFPSLTGQQLIDSLRVHYTPASTLGYNNARDTLYAWENATYGELRGVYTGFAVVLDPAADPSTDAYNKGINAEHTWPQSLGAGAEPAKSDLHHLFPVKANVNSSRSNHPYDDIPDAETDGWYRLADSQSNTPTTLIDEWSEKDNDHPDPGYTGRFEPREDHKGDAARAALYFYTIYQSAADQDFFDVQQERLVRWHVDEAVDQREYDRSAFIAGHQGTDNPFILDTTLVRRAFGSPAPPPPPPPPPATADVWINEIHYDNSGSDTGEGIEVAGSAGTDLAGWQVIAYNGSGGASYKTTNLSGTLPSQQGGLGTKWFAIAGLQNGAPDGIALVDDGGAVIQFLSYEGSFTAVGGAADGLTSDNIGVSETSSTPVGHSLQLTGTGSTYADFTWASATADTPDAVNTGQTFEGTAAPTAWINEIHYDDSGSDKNEGVEIAGTAGVDLAGWQLVAYNGNGGSAYKTTNLSGTLADQSGGFGTEWFAISGLQNGAPDGIALVDDGGAVVQFLSYEGSFTAVGGAADGLTSDNIGVSESSSTPNGHALQLTGTGTVYADFTWSGPSSHSRGDVNDGQSFGAAKGGPALAAETPSGFALSSVYPNPFNPEATFTLRLDAPGAVTIAVYDALGRRVALLHDGFLAGAQTHRFRFTADRLPSGVYFLTVRGAALSEVRKMVLMK